MKPTKNSTGNIFRQPLTWLLIVSLTTFSSCFRSSYRSSEGCPAMNSAAMKPSFRGR
ncbi:hypothetical protein [Flaviaesturariibacter aridisoli]|uniref:hypothetical protein n=1 Tax=Flaviaesturariibacter aridisoli TaxID=2545761 RepID=UPI001404AC31|nr:hypothetical protein [Flaviaesturariibacter aridisoli]